MNSVRSTWVMSCISRPVNAIGTAPRPIRRWGISRSHSLAVKPHTVNPAGEGGPDRLSGIDREKSAARVDARLLPDQLRLHSGAIFGRSPAPSPCFTRRLHLILFVKIREAIVRLSEGRIGHDRRARFAVSCGIEGRRCPTVHRPHHFTQIPASHFTLLLAFDAAGRERQCSEPFDRNFSAALLAFSVTAALETLERSLDGLEPLFGALRQIHQHIAVQFGTRNIGLVAGYARSVTRLSAKSPLCDASNSDLVPDYQGRWRSWLKERVLSTSTASIHPRRAWFTP